MPKVRQAVITAAGRGTRHFPATAAVQKELFPLVDRDGHTRPLIQIIGQEALASGIERLCIVTPPGGAAVYRDYFGRRPTELGAAFGGQAWAMREAAALADFGARLHFVAQPTPEGFGHAVYQARAFVGAEPFLLLLGDHVFISDTPERCARQLIGEYEAAPVAALTAVQMTPEALLGLFGTIRGTPVDGARGLYRAEQIVEKPSVEVARRELATPGLPAGQYLAHFGQHIFSPQIFESLEYLIRNDIREKGEFQLTAAQEHLRQQTGDYRVLVARGRRYDAGIPYGLLETQMALGLAGVHGAELRRALAAMGGQRPSAP
jgi:UTP--glucose-1-phosphate uridylyltransferase